MLIRPSFSLTDGNYKPLKTLGRVRSINDLKTRNRIEPRLLCAGRFAYLDLQPWAKKQAETKDPAFAESFERFRLTLASFCDMATRNTLDRFTGTNWKPRPPGVHPDGNVNPYMKPYVFEPIVVKIELTMQGVLDNLKRCFDDLNTMRDSNTRFGRRIYAQMTGLHDEIKALFDLYYQHRPSDQEYQRVAENLSEVNRQLRGITALAEQARDLMTKAEDSRQATEAMLAEAHATHEQTQQVAADLGERFDKTMAYNQEVTRYSMTRDDWGLLLSQQIERYYKPLSASQSAGGAQDGGYAPQNAQTPRRPAHAPKFAFQDLAKMRQPGTLKK